MSGLAEIPALLTVIAAAELLRLSPRGVLEAIAAGELPACRCGGEVFVPARVLLVALGVRPDTPDLPATVAVLPVRGVV